MIVTIDEVKTHLRIQHDEEDAYLTSLIAQAQAAAEDYCRTQFSDPAPEPVRLAVLLMVGFYYENRDIPDMTTYKAMRMAFDSLLYGNHSFLQRVHAHQKNQFSQQREKLRRQSGVL